MEQLLGKEWEISPAGGATGDAYIAEHDGKKLFLKRNSSPFLAVLSAEGIVPKLVWTKRMENGDVITAQQFLHARELKPHDMTSKQVAQLLRKIHRSKELLAMMERLGKKPLLPNRLLEKIKENRCDELKEHPIVTEAIAFLERHVDDVRYADYVVCHCDMNHNNWLLTEDNQLYLIDWDSAMIADPAIDIGMLLYAYIPREQWESWLEEYGLAFDEQLQLRMKWYTVAQTIALLVWHKGRNNEKEMQRLLHFLEHLLR
ncbi:MULTISPECIES: phosphotransferase family protein [Anoxybacillus]|uniref:Phosphotransferase, choline kinase enzyme n=1 Tax=Anoxybacillus flavithermus AK1 TaxID=1297581 RepID=M8D301_9BACL|nr:MULTISPECIES: phosphotransferase family protein [Anoxybacillus]EMT45201.1 phosphotransferase, choline kinase enzyme [Anoxybacillus flavithermus AK1]MBW7650000.1 phosphotransferase family protein [Anoxybacillus sp. ST4]